MMSYEWGFKICSYIFPSNFFNFFFKNLIYVMIKKTSTTFLVFAENVFFLLMFTLKEKNIAKLLQYYDPQKIEVV